MEYRRFIARVEALPFVADWRQADAQTKAVLGMLASNLDPALARRLTDRLPDPLTLNRLRGHQVRTERLSAEDYLAELQSQFGISREQAHQLVLTVLEAARESAGKCTFDQVADNIAPEIAELIRRM